MISSVLLEGVWKEPTLDCGWKTTLIVKMAIKECGYEANDRNKTCQSPYLCNRNS